MGLSIEQQLADLENQMAVLKQKIEEQKQEKEWPQVGDYYYLVDCQGESMSWRYAGDGSDMAAQSIGNIFKTKEQAEEHANYLKTMALLRKQPGRVNFYDGYDASIQYCGFCISLKDDGSVFGIHIAEYYETDAVFGNVWFDSHKAAQKALEVVGEDAIIAADKHESGLGM